MPLQFYYPHTGSLSLIFVCYIFDKFNIKSMPGGRTTDVEYTGKSSKTVSMKR